MKIDCLTKKTQTQASLIKSSPEKKLLIGNQCLSIFLLTKSMEDKSADGRTVEVDFIVRFMQTDSIDESPRENDFNDGSPWKTI